MSKRSVIPIGFVFAALFATVLWTVHPLAHLDHPEDASTCPICTLAKVADAPPAVPPETLVAIPVPASLPVPRQAPTALQAGHSAPRQPRAPPAFSVSL